MADQREQGSPSPKQLQCLGGVLWHGDVLASLERIAPEPTFDVVLADPPYNIGKDFGAGPTRHPIEEYVAWSEEWMAACLERLRDDGVMYMYGFPEIVARIAARYPLDNQRWLVWHYENKTVPASQFWQRSHETVLCLWKAGHSRPRLEVDNIREPYTAAFLAGAAGKQRASTRGRYSHTENITQYHAHENGALPRDVIKVPALAGGAGASERWFMCLDCGRAVLPPWKLTAHASCRVMKHPTQKPAEVTRKLLNSRLPRSEGDAPGSVLIPFAGSGSECVVAYHLGIPYVGVERNADYVEFARKWLERADEHNPLVAAGGMTDESQLRLW